MTLGIAIFFPLTRHEIRMMRFDWLKMCGSESILTTPYLHGEATIGYDADQYHNPRKTVMNVRTYICTMHTAAA